MQPKKKIAIFFPYFIKGGSDVIVAQTIDTLKGKYNISLFTCDTYKKIAMLNGFCGTYILPEDITIINPPFSFLLRIIPGLGLLKYHLLVRYFKLLNTHFDILFGMYKEIDFGTIAIQYIHVPELDRNDQKASKSQVKYYQNYLMGSAYKKLCYFISGFKSQRMKKNVTIVDSGWAKNIVEKTLGIRSNIIYPPVAVETRHIPFDKKEDGFVYLGRITPPKEIEKIINIVSKVRKSNEYIHLHIVGPIDHLHMEYVRFIEKLCSQNKEWCFFEGQMGNDKKMDFLSRYKYGISGCVNEAFGIAVAEMIKAGCIVFVPNGGGQIEIINQAQLMYENEDDAVSKIINVLKDRNAQTKLQQYLLSQSQKFSVDNFKNSISAIIDEFLKQNNANK